MKYFLFAILLSSVFNSKAQIAANATEISPLLIGETMPNSILVDQSNTAISTTNILNNKKTVMVFYRGGWCPFCNIQLAALAHAESEILKLGYQVVAVTPESFENLKATAETDSVKYKIYSDPKGEFSQKVGIAFQMPKDYVGYIATKSKGKLTEILPVPTILVLDEKGMIVYEYINVNYKTRMSKELLIATLKNLNN
jgi:peroxiredoxin